MGWGESRAHGDREFEREVLRKLDEIINGQRTLFWEEASMAVDLSELQAAVANEGSVENSVVTLLGQLSAKIDELSQAETVDPADLKALADQINADSDALAAAAVANTPADPSAPTPQ